jgi:hypothetical protein
MSNHPTGEKYEANAHLIAAAPRMYAALVTLHCYLDFDEPWSDGDLGIKNVASLNAALRAARAAIAAAEGRANA